MSREPTTADRLADFKARYSYIVTNALDSHERMMREAAKNARESYETLTADPERAAAHDASGSLITVRGFLMSAEMFTESADKDKAAADAWRELAGEEW